MKSTLLLILAMTALYSGSSFAQDGGAAGMGGGGNDGEPMDLIMILNSHPEMNKCDGIKQLILMASPDLRLPKVKSIAVVCDIKLPESPSIQTPLTILQMQ